MIIPALAEFSQRHPAPRVRHVSSSHHADLISERFDVAIRLGTLADSRYRAALISVLRLSRLPRRHGWRNILWRRLKIWPGRHGLFMSGCPRHAIGSSPDRATRAWLLTLKRCRDCRRIAPARCWRSRWRAAGCAVARVAGGAGTGGAQTDSGDARVYLSPQGVYAVYPDAQHIPTRVRAFIDFLRERQG